MASSSSDQITLSEAVRALRDKMQGLAPSSARTLIRMRYPHLNPTVEQVKNLITTNVSARTQPFDAKFAQHLRRFDVGIPNSTHTADLLALPNDRGHKYALVVKDAASRYTGAAALQSKTADEVAAAFRRLYKETPLDFPRRLQVDGGKEFAGAVTKLMGKHGTAVSRGAPGDHLHAALSERANSTIARRLFDLQYRNEEATGKTSRVWVSRLDDIVETMNELPMRILNGDTPARAITKEVVAHAAPSRKDMQRLREAMKDPVLPVGTMVRVPLDQPPDGGRWRATDMRWSQRLKITDLRELPGRPAEYQVEGKPGRWYTYRHFNLD